MVAKKVVEKGLGRVEEIRNGVNVRLKVKEGLDRKYGLVENGTIHVSTLLKSKIHSGSTKIRWYLEANMRVRQNNLFRNNQSQLYKELGSAARSGSNSAPKAEEAKEFWSVIWSVEKVHDSDASWLGDVKREMKGIEEQEEITIGKEEVLVGIRKMANWKAPGPDGVRGFWFKKFDSLHPALTISLQRCLESGEVPEWMVKGRILQKELQANSMFAINVEAAYRDVCRKYLRSPEGQQPPSRRTERM